MEPVPIYKKNPNTTTSVSGGDTLPTREELENEIQPNISEFDVSQVCQMLRLRRKRCGVYHLFYSRLVEFFKANLDQLSFQKSLRRIGYLSFATSI
jgi:hypothetical protein